MSNLENMRIVCDDIMPWGHLKLYDNDGTELPLHGVQDIEVTIPVGGPVRATVQMLTEIDVQADVTIERRRLNADTGEYERIDVNAIRAAVNDLRTTAYEAGRGHPADVDAALRDLFVAIGLPEDEA